MKMAALTIYLQLFCIFIFVLSTKAIDYEKQLSSQMNRQISLGLSQFKNYQHFETTFQRTLKTKMPKNQNLVLSEIPIKVLFKLDDNIVKTYTTQLDPPNFEPLTEHMEVYYDKLNVTSQKLTKIRDDLELIYLESQKDFENLEFTLFECEYPDELGSRRQDLMDYYETEAHLIKQVVIGKLNSANLEGREGTKEFTEIQSTARILLNDWSDNLSSSLQPLQKQMMQDFSEVMQRCTEVFPEAKSINTKLSLATHKAIAEMTTNMAEVNRVVAEWEIVRKIKSVVAISNEEDSNEEITEIPNILPIRRNKQAKIETLEDGNESETVLLKEQQRNDRNSEIFSLTKLQNGKVVDVKKWLIKY